MLKQTTVDRIRELLSQNVSQRKVAKQVGVARETVRRIVNGTRRDRDTEQDDALVLFEGDPERCPECGGMVWLPCLACRARVYKAAG